MMKNNPSNNRNSYYLIDNSTVITDSQSAILTLANTTILEKNVDLDNNLNSIPDQSDTSITSDTEPDSKEFSNTLDVFDNTFKKVQYQKIKDILLEYTKKDMCNLMQNEIRQTTNLYSQDEHQTLVDKKSNS